MTMPGMFEYFLKARWNKLVMANYAVDPSLLEPYLPVGTALDYHQGKTYLSLVGFQFADTRIFGIPIPFMGTFDEINLRFYVLRREHGVVKRGVVFIQEAVPNRTVALVANLLYKEHYAVLPAYHQWKQGPGVQEISYHWKKQNRWNHLEVVADAVEKPMAPGSAEEFIFEHYYGFAKLSDTETSVYQVEHPRWLIHDVKRYAVECDFGAMYGDDFAFLANEQPASVMLAKGSPVAVKWKRGKIGIDKQPVASEFRSAVEHQPQ
jgi:uncharacterized protein YqjF (DUF2071 family)